MSEQELQFKEEQRRKSFDTPDTETESRFVIDPPAEREEPTAPTTRRSQSLDNTMHIETAAINSYLNGGSVVENLVQMDEEEEEESAVGEDARKELKKAAKEKGKTDIKDVHDMLVRNPGSTPEEALFHVQQAQLLEAEIMKESADYHGQSAESLSNFMTTERQKTKIKTALQLREMLDSLTQDLSAGDYVQMLAAPLLPGYETVTKVDAADGDLLSTDMFTLDQKWNDFTIRFNELPAEQQIDLFPTIIDHLVETSPDRVTAEDSLRRLIERRDNNFYLHPLWTIADLTGLGLVASPIVKTVKNLGLVAARLVKKLNMPKVLKNSELGEEAEEFVAASLRTTEEEFGGLFKVEQRDDAIPINQHADNADDAQRAVANEFDIVSKGDEKAPAYVAGTSTKSSQILGELRREEDEIARLAAKNKADAQRGDQTVESVAEEYKEFDQRAEGILQGVREGTLINRETLIDPQSRLTLEDKFAAQLKDPSIENGVVEVLSKQRLNTQTIFTYSKVDANGAMTTERASMPLKLNDIKSWEVDNATLFGRLAFSNQALAGQALEGKGWVNAAKNMLLGDVKAAQRTEQKVAAFHKELSKLMDEALAPLGKGKRLGRWDPAAKESIAKINEALETGNMWRDDVTGIRGKRFTIQELRDGAWTHRVGSHQMVPSDLASQLDNAEIQAYYRARRVFDLEYQLMNDVARDEYAFKGFKGFKFRVKELGEGESTEKVIRAIGKPYATPQTALFAMNEIIQPGLAKTYYNSVTGKMEIYGATSMKRFYDAGYRLVKADGRVKITPETGEVDFILASNKDIGQLPRQVLPYNEGYVPTYHVDGAFWIKESVDTKVNGVAGTRTKTPRFFKTRTEASAWIAKQPSPEKFRAVQDGELAAWSKQQRFTGNSDVNVGTMHFGGRAEETPVFGTTDEYRMMPALQAMNRSMGNVSKYVGNNEWILGVKQRWINTANELTGGHPPVKSFGKLNEELAGTQQGEFLQHWARQIEMWEGFQPPSHRAWENLMQSTYEWMQKSKWRGKGWISPTIWRAKDVDPTAAAKSIAFHSFLGWFNPVQMFVQGQGGIVALGMNLEAGRVHWIPKILKEQNALRMIINDPHRVNLDKVAKIHGMDANYLQKLKDEYILTGMDDSIRTNADYEAALQGYGQGTDAVRSVADSGLWFYRSGEKFTRRVAWLTARMEADAAFEAAVNPAVGRVARASGDVPLPGAAKSDAAIRARVLEENHHIIDGKKVPTKNFEQRVEIAKAEAAKADMPAAARAQAGVDEVIGAPEPTAVEKAVQALKDFPEEVGVKYKPEKPAIHDRIEAKLKAMKVKEVRDIARQMGLQSGGKIDDRISDILNARAGFNVLKKYDSLDAFDAAVEAGHIDKHDLLRWARAVKKGNNKTKGSHANTKLNSLSLWQAGKTADDVKIPMHSPAKQKLIDEVDAAANKESVASLEVQKASFEERAAFWDENREDFIGWWGKSTSTEREKLLRQLDEGKGRESTDRQYKKWANSEINHLPNGRKQNISEGLPENWENGSPKWADEVDPNVAGVKTEGKVEAGIGKGSDDTASSKVIQTGDVPDAYSDEIRNAVHSRAIDLTLNMGKANAAAWQKGIFGVTTQFQQITSKSLEAVTGMNSAFTPHERFKMGMGQLFAYGAAGVPFGTMGMMMLENELGKEFTDSLPTVAVEMINGGAMDSMVYAVTGVSTEAAQRGALNGGFEGWISSVWNDDTNRFEWLLGPSGNVGGKVWDSLTLALRPLILGSPNHGIVDGVAAIAMMPLTALSSVNNATKGYLVARHGELYNNKGDVTIDGLGLTDAFIKAIGFQLGKESTLYHLKDFKQEQIERVNDIAQVVNVEFRKLLQKGPENITREMYEVNANFNAAMMELLTDEERILVNKRRIGLIDQEPQFKRLYENYVKYHSNKIANEITGSVSFLQSAGLIQTEGKVFRTKDEEE